MTLAEELAAIATLIELTRIRILKLDAHYESLDLTVPEVES